MRRTSTHPLRAEIIATLIANAMIDRGGPTYVLRMADQTGATPVAIARAFATARDSFELPALNAAIDALDNKVPGMEQLGLYAPCRTCCSTGTVWFLRNVDLSEGLDGSRRRTIAKASRRWRRRSTACRRRRWRRGSARRRS